MSHDLKSLLRPLNPESKELTELSLSILPISVPSSSALIFQGNNPQFQHTFVHYMFDRMLVLSYFSKQHNYDVLLASFLLSAVLDRNSRFFYPEKVSQPQPQILRVEEDVERPFEYDPFLYKITKYRGRLYLIATICLAEEDLSDFDFKLNSLIGSFEDRCEEFHKEILRGLMQKVDIGLKVKDFLATTGFKNIKESLTSAGQQSLVIAMVEDEDMPLSIRRFPIRFEIAADMLTIRVFFSINDPTESFTPCKDETILEVIKAINSRSEAVLYTFNESEREVVLLFRQLTQGISEEKFTSLIYQARDVIIEHYKWSSTFFHWITTNTEQPFNTYLAKLPIECEFPRHSDNQNSLIVECGSQNDSSHRGSNCSTSESPTSPPIRISEVEPSDFRTPIHLILPLYLGLRTSFSLDSQDVPETPSRSQHQRSSSDSQNYATQNTPWIKESDIEFTQVNYLLN